MPNVDIHNLGALGLNRDIPNHLLPPEAWSDARNVRFEDNKVRTSAGHDAVFDPPVVAPYWLLPVQTAAENFWIYAGVNKVYVFDGTNHFDITRASGGDYSMDLEDLWNGGILGGIPILNNGVDDPQYWAPLSTGQRLQDLSNWPTNTKARVIRPYKNFLVGLDITAAGTNFPFRVKWSDAADPGALPSSWDPADPTKLAGEVDLTTFGSGPCVDQLQLRDLNVIYKQNATVGMQLIGGQAVFRFFTLLESSGLLSSDCVASLGAGEAHYLHNGEEILLFDGQSTVRVMDKKMTRWLQNAMSPSNYQRAFMVPNLHRREMWFCFPEGDAEWPNLALTWSWVDGTPSVREISPASHMTNGLIVENEATSWDSDNESWDSDTTTWDSFKHKLHERRLLQADPANTKLYFVDDETTNLFAGSVPLAFVERLGLALAGRDRVGQPKVDLQSQKTVIRLWPKITGGPVNIRVGGQERIGGPVTWQPMETFDPTTQQYIDFFITYPLIAVRFESTANVAWILEGYDLDLDVSSEL